ncbi:MAG: hypothetical protein HY658_05855 [Actinobacteria bacterium]|nr:hypothetical protein [Actinomycetota bacterium]
MEALVFVLIALAAVGIGVLSWYLKKRRREEFQRMAHQLGLQYSASDPFGLLGLPFSLFSKGDGRGIENVVWGTWQGLDLKEFDYWYYEETTDSEGHRSKTYYRFSCAVTEIAALCSPLSISRENVFTRLADRLGFQDIDFELGEFNRAFQVKSKDRKFAYDFVDQRMMQWLLSAGKGWSFETSGPYLVCFSSRRRPTELIPLLGTLRAFRDQVPRVVYSLYGAGVPPAVTGPDLPPPPPG